MVLTILVSIFGGLILLFLLYLAVGWLLYFIAFKRKKFSKKIEEFAHERKKEMLGFDFTWWNGVKAEGFDAVSFDGFKLKGYLLKQDKKKLVMVVHGYLNTYKEMHRFCELFYNKGYSVFIADNRAHGESEGDFMGMGWLDRLDQLVWINKMIRNFGKDVEIVMFGLSMGSATVTMLSGEELPLNVRAIISDCGFDSVVNQFKHVLKKIHIPSFPAINLLVSYMRRIKGYNIARGKGSEQVKKAKVPILYIHGGADNFVPTKMVYSLYDATPARLRTLKIFENAAHANSIVKYKDKYLETVTNFLAEQIGWK